MNFALFSMILICSIQISVFDQLTRFDVWRFHNLVPSAIISYTNETMACTIIWVGAIEPEIPYVYLYCNATYLPAKNQPNTTLCTGFDCWESQLTTATRIQIAEIMNKYREKVARGRCQKWCAQNKNRVVYELEWNYFLEQNATGYLATCARNRFINRTLFYTGLYDSPDSAPAYKELVVTSFKMETGLQSELRSILWRLLHENRLKDWDEESQFRRGDYHNVACAFACRRGINFVTDLNETVENGIVGHLSCVFATLYVNLLNQSGELVPVPYNTTNEPLERNCFQRPFRSTLRIYNLYATLCRTGDDILNVPNAYAYHACDFGPQNAPNLCPESQYSFSTWEEKQYGMTMSYKQAFPNGSRLITVESCNVPTVPTIISNDSFVISCTLTQAVTMQANAETCFGWNCADSQLTDLTRGLIMDKLNWARNLVAGGGCSDDCPHPCKRCNLNVRYCNMANLRWHWYLERKASEIVQNCPTNYSIRRNLAFDDEPFPFVHEISYEEVTLLFDLPHDAGQTALPDTFLRLFWRNAFEDWTDYHYFRRGNAKYIGCSIVSRPYTNETSEIKPEMNFYNGTLTHMVCIYASLNGSFTSVLAESEIDCCPVCPNIEYYQLANEICLLRHQKVENLCYELPIFPIVQNCQKNESCTDNSTSKAWGIEYKGIMVRQTINGTLLMEESNETEITTTPTPTSTTTPTPAPKPPPYCLFLALLSTPQIVLWILLLYFYYSFEDMRSVQLLASSQKIPSDENDENESISESDIASQKAESKTTIPPPKTQRTSRTTTSAPYTSPAASKTPIREARLKDEELGEEEEYEYVTGSGAKISVKHSGPRRIYTGRPRREKKSPKRAKTKAP